MKNQFKIFANYGVLGREKRVVYSYYTPITEVSDEIIVELPENDIFSLYENIIGDIMVETAWGHCYRVDDVLQGKENPCFYALDLDAKGHRVQLKIIEE